MKKNMDKITFENRNEICNIITALDTFLEDHTGEETCRDVERLCGLLEVMAMEW